MDLVRAIWFVFVGTWRASRWRFALSASLTIAGAVSAPFVAVELKHVTNSALVHDTRSATIAGALAGVFVILSLTLAHFAHVFFFEIADLYVVGVTEELIALSNGTVGIEQHERPEYADRLELLRQEYYVLWRAVEVFMTSIALAVAIVTTAVLLVAVSPWLLLLPLFAIPPLLGGHYANAISERARVACAQDQRLGRHLLRLATTAEAGKEIRVFGLQDELRGRDQTLWERTSNRLWRASLRGTVVGMLGQLLFAAGYVGAVLLVVRRAVGGHGSVGAVVLTIVLATQVNSQVAQAVRSLSYFQHTAKVVGRLLWLRRFVEQMTFRRADPAPVPGRLEHGIELDAVTFRYSGTDRDVLRDVTLTLPAGTTVAIVGENGAGKSTLVKLLCRFYEPSDGTITVDGVELSRFDPSEWRRRIAAGFQDFARFELVARESVGVGELTQMNDEATVLAAVDRAHAGDVIRALPDGLESHIGKSYLDGLELSGGQWQKIALSRAMMRDAPLLLILDEPTSALDAHAEHALFERYAHSARVVGRATGAVTVFVSHRFSTVLMADLILVVRDGEIVERGSHAELVALGGTYAELYELQAAAYR
ncbi:MAG TPA: ABC transporter ATP-binding protein [Gaiellaceae bacterium]|nr:ABC transporter ATP-binding protein [Gaiellaceae bacterium]